MDYILSFTGKSVRSVRDAVSSRIWPAPEQKVHFQDSNVGAAQENTTMEQATGLSRLTI